MATKVFHWLIMGKLVRAPDSKVRGPGFDTRSESILSFLLPLFQEGQLSVPGESMYTKYWLRAVKPKTTNQPTA